jgi:hypothetical protein
MKVASLPIIPQAISSVRNQLRSVLTITSESFDTQKPVILAVHLAMVERGAVEDEGLQAIVATSTGGSWESSSGSLAPVDVDAVSPWRWGQISKGAYFYGNWVGLFRPLSEPVIVSSGIMSHADFYLKSRFSRRWRVKDAPRISGQCSIFVAPRKTDITGIEPLIGGGVTLGFMDGA